MEIQDDAAPRSFLSLSWQYWQRAPLYLRIVLALILGMLVGLAWGPAAGGLGLPGQLVLRLLGALAPPLILAAIVHALMTAQLEGRLSLRLARLLILNTLVAICVGLTVANVLKPGVGAPLKPPTAVAENAAQGHPDPWLTFLENIPKSLLGPLGDNGKVLGVIVIALAFGIALRRERARPLGTPQISSSYSWRVSYASCTG